MSFRHCSPGDRMLVTFEVIPAGASPLAWERNAQVVTEVVTVASVTRLGCGCDRAELPRPRSHGGPCPSLHLLPASCHHHVGAIDYDQARAGAALPRDADLGEAVAGQGDLLAMLEEVR